jgi:hypothetical protein
MANEAFFVQGGNYDGQEFRRLLKTFYRSSSSLGAVIFGLAVVSPSTGNVKVQTGAAFVLDSGGGAYIGATQADSANISIPSASGSPRTDTIYAVIQDPGSGATAGEMAFGRAAGTFVVPSLAIPLAHVTANLDGTLTIVDVREIVEAQAAGAADTGEYALTLLNSWALGPGAAFGPTVRRLGSKQVYLRADLGTQGAGPVMCSLPAIYRPTYTRTFAVSCQGGAVGVLGTVIVMGVLNPSPGYAAGDVFVGNGGSSISFSVDWPVD